MKRSHVLLATLLCVVVAAYLAPDVEPDDVVKSVRSSARKTPDVSVTRPTHDSATSGQTVLTLRPRSQLDEEQEVSPFSVPTAIAPAIPLPAPPSPPPPPQAPPIPFIYLGKYSEAGTSDAVFLQYNDEVLIVRVGDSLIGQYKVESIAGNTMELRYVPLNQLQAIGIDSVI